MQMGQTFLHYVRELIVPLVIGFGLSGVLNEFLPAKSIQKYLGGNGLQPILTASVFGTLLPLCCFGTLPIAITLRKKGARLGPVLAFLVTTPATSVSALLVCWKLLGLGFTVYIFFAVILLGLVLGLAGNLMPVPPPPPEEHEAECACCHHKNGSEPTLASRALAAAKYAFVVQPREIGFDLVLGLLIASVVAGLPLMQTLIREYIAGAWGYLFAILTGLLTYVCSTAHVPIVSVFIQSGLSVGAGMTYLLIGPITSYSNLLVIRREFGPRVLAVFLAVICVMSLGLGILYGSL